MSSALPTFALHLGLALLVLLSLSCPGARHVDPGRSSPAIIDVPAAIPSAPSCEVACSEGQICRRGRCRGAIAEVVVADGFGCARSHDGAVVCFGNNRYGELGSPQDIRNCSPRAVPLEAPAAQLVATRRRACAVTAAGEVWCWGQTMPSSCREPSQFMGPNPVNGFTAPVTSLSMVWDVACATLETGRVMCFYAGDDGQGCSPPTRDAYDMGLTDIRQVVVTAGLVCALHQAGNVTCWGEVYWSDYLEPTAWSWVGRPDDHPAMWDLGVGTPDVVELALTGSTVCVRREGGRVECWRPDYHSELHTAPDWVTIEALSDLEGVRHLALDTMTGQVCALYGSAALRCAASNGTEGAIWEGTEVAALASDMSGTNAYSHPLACIADTSGQLMCESTYSAWQILDQPGRVEMVSVAFGAADLERIEALCSQDDADGDGVVDAADLCSDAAEVFNGIDDSDGCPDVGEQLVEVDPENRQIILLQPIEFEIDSHTILASSYPVLDQVGDVIRNHAGIGMVTIEGHINFEEYYSRSLSQDRAQSVRVYLITEAGLAQERLSARGYGNQRPIANNDTPEGSAQNRRIELYFQSP